MVDYVVLDQTGSPDVPARLRARCAGKALDQAVVPESSGLPRYLRESLVFPYAAGARLVEPHPEPRRLGGRQPRLRVARAAVSTEQVMHPAKYDSRERPVRVRVARAGRDAAGARPGDFGEFDTEQLLREANGEERAARAAAGWGGGGFALWRRPERALRPVGALGLGQRPATRASSPRRRVGRPRRLGGATVSQRR